MDNLEQGSEQPKTSLLADTSGIQESRNQMIVNREQIKDLIEEPLVRACEDMWDKNIRTLSTSANKKDIETGEAYIIVDFGSMSEANKQTAQQYAEPIDYDGMKTLKITVPVSETTTTDEISQKTSEIAAAFKKQPATWIPTYKLSELKKAYGIDPEETKYDDPSVWQEQGYYYDPESGLFYMSKEHYNKANENIDEE